MIIKEAELKGVFIIEPDKISDTRGFFARSFCKKEFEKYGLKTEVVQCNISFNEKKGTLRGLHFQLPPKSEAKLVRCTKGTIFDVFVDLRPESKTYCNWGSITLSEDNHKSVYIPEGFAHGFQTLRNESEVSYHMFEYYDPEYNTGVKYDDVSFNISWPINNPVISEKDKTCPPYTKVSD